MNKYTFTKETKLINEKLLHRIKALKDFGSVKAGDLGGFIEKEENLSQLENCWVFEKACVYGDAYVYENAQVFENARIFGNAQIFDNAQVYGSARISGNACVCGYAQVFGNARVKGNAQIFESAKVFGNAQIYENAKIYNTAIVHEDAVIDGKAYVYGNAVVCGCAYIYGDVLVYGDAFISQHRHVCYGIVKTNLSKDLITSIKAQCNLPVIDNKIIAYKLVRPDLISFYDRDFQYVVGEEIEVKDCDESDEPCASGLHFSNLTYWEKECESIKHVFLEAEIDLNDIITVQLGKIRCRKAKILRSFSLD